ncbi:MAG: TetR/AcrR family transcriptional regulator C-terminal domain-containing protein [Clostridia bacterium]|nr:TetR/AcrR family transcriptional regulator C-terminal domain-containing protein [Clostridia bacterium]
MKKERKPDRRVAKTQKAIREAFLSLMEEKTVDKISMKEIAERADVDRKTVYNYYSGIYAIQESLENDLILQFEEVMKNIEYTLDEPSVLLAGLTKLLEENIEIYDRIVHLKNNQHLMHNIVEFLEGKLLEAINKTQPNIAETKKEMVARYVTMGTVSVYYQWFSAGKQRPLQELSNDINKLVKEGLLAFIKE